MSKLNEVRIIGVGKALPGPPRTNEETLDHCNIIDKDDPLAREKALRWVKEKVGIDTRHTCREFPIVSTFAPRKGECNSDLGALAITEALKVAEMEKDELDLIIVATCTPDYPIPSTASIVQEKLGIAEIAVIDIRSACCGSMQAMITAIQYAKTGYYRNIAVVGAEVGSVFGNLDKDSEGYSRQDFVNALMIGDGAGAVIFRSFKDGEDPFGIEILHYGMNAIGLGEEPGMYLPLGGSMMPATHERLTQGLQYFKHDFRKVLEHGPILYVRAMNDALAGAGLSIGDIDLFVPHQANARIAAGAAKFQVPPERIFQNFQKVGNTANASLMLCMDDIATQGIVPDGGIVLLAAAESTKWLYASMVLRWQNIKNKDARALAKRKRDPLWKRAFWTVGWFLLSAGVQFNKSTVTAMGIASAATLAGVFAYNKYTRPSYF